MIRIIRLNYIFSLLSAALIAWLSAVSLYGQTSTDLKTVQIEPFASQIVVHPGESCQVHVAATIKKGFHINSHKPLEEFLMPTELAFNPVKGVSFGTPVYPEPRLISVSFSALDMSVFEGRITIRSMVTVSEDMPPGDIALPGRLDYQACDDQRCYMPESRRFEIPLTIAKLDEQVSKTGETAKPANEDVIQHNTSLTSDEQRANQVIEKGLLYAVAAFFLFGLALNLTPCVYPMIPLTIGFFGAQGSQERQFRFLLALSYLIGIALIFSLLGLVSGMAGKQWGFLFQNTWFVIFISVIVLSMAANMFGAFEIRMPAFFMNRMGKPRQGIIGSFLMGLTVGVVVAPCAAGIVIGLVGVIAKLGMAVKGALLFFVMGLGLGMPYLILALFSSLLKHLPQSGFWMVWVRKLFGILLIGVALYFLVPQAKAAADMQAFFFGVLGIFGGILFGFLDSGRYSRIFKIIRGAAGCLLILAGMLIVQRAIHQEAEPIDWIRYSGQSMEELTEGGLPIIMEFTADWCAVCKEMDRKTFNQERIVTLSKKFTMVRVDCTSSDEVCSDLAKRYGISGLPAIIFFAEGGEKLPDLTAVGFVEPEKLLRNMESAAGR